MYNSGLLKRDEQLFGPADDDAYERWRASDQDEPKAKPAPEPLVEIKPNSRKGGSGSRPPEREYAGDQYEFTSTYGEAGGYNVIERSGGAVGRPRTGTSSGEEAARLVLERAQGHSLGALRRTLGPGRKNREMRDAHATLKAAVQDIRREKLATPAALAEALDCSEKTVERLAAGAAPKPQAAPTAPARKLTAAEKRWLDSVAREGVYAPQLAAPDWEGN